MGVRGIKLFVVFALAILAPTASLAKGQEEVPPQELDPAPPKVYWIGLPDFVKAILPEDLKCAPGCVLERLCFVRNYHSCRYELPNISLLVCILASLDSCDLMHVNDSMVDKDNEFFLKKTPHPNSADDIATADEGGRR